MRQSCLSLGRGGANGKPGKSPLTKGESARQALSGLVAPQGLRVLSGAPENSGVDRACEKSVIVQVCEKKIIHHRIPPNPNKYRAKNFIVFL